MAPDAGGRHGRRRVPRGYGLGIADMVLREMPRRQSTETAATADAENAPR